MYDAKRHRRVYIIIYLYALYTSYIICIEYILFSFRNYLLPTYKIRIKETRAYIRGI